MSRTKRMILQDPETGRSPAAERRPEGDRRRSFRHRIRRDNAATGLRDHKTERSQARRRLKEEPERDDLRAGRTRKYQEKRGNFLM